MKLSDIRSRLSITNKEKSENTLENDNLTTVSENETNETINNELTSDSKFQSTTYKITIIRIVLAVAVLLICHFVKMTTNISAILKIIVGVVVGYDLVIKTVSDLTKRDFTKENLPIVLSAVALFAVGQETFAVLVLLIAQASIISRDYVLSKTREIWRANVQADDSIHEDNMLLISDGQAFPCDCVISDGSAIVDFGIINGNTNSVSVQKFDFVPAGVKCISGKVSAKIVNSGNNTLCARIEDTVECGSRELTPLNKRINKLANYFMPVCILISLIILFLLPVIGNISIKVAVVRISAILAISSPIGMILQISNTYFLGMSSAKKEGIVFKNAIALEKTSNIGAIIFDKVGTLTSNSYVVSDINSDKMDPETFIKVAAYVANESNSPIAKAIVKSYGKEISKGVFNDFKEIPDKGVVTSVENIKIRLGKENFIKERLKELPECDFDGIPIYMTVDDQYAGRIILSNSTTKDTGTTFNDLSILGIDRIAMLSSDGRKTDSSIAEELGLDEYYSECPINEKTKRVSETKKRIDPKKSLAYVGNSDLIDIGNDDLGPFYEADIGISINGISNPSMLEDMDLTILEDSIKPIVNAVKTAKLTRKKLVIGLSSCFGIKILMIILSIIGITPAWFTITMDSCFTLAVMIDILAPIFRRLENKENTQSIEIE